MKLKYIEWQNIKSYGNKLQRIDFPDQGSLWQILGKNGNGKSTLLDLPKILYYGKLNDFKKDELANRLNRHGWIKGEVQTGPNTSVVIERTISPSNLVVYKKDENGELVDIGKSGISNYQDYIDEEVVGLPYHIFSNIISLSINDFKSFISMTPNDKRIIIDKLFTMEVLNQMYELVKKDLKEIKSNINLYNKEIDSLNENIRNASKELEKLKENVDKDNTERVKYINEQMTQYKNKFEEIKKKLKQYQDKQKEIQKSYDVFIQQKTNINAELNDIKKQINLYNKDKCPTCGTDFHARAYELLKEDLKEKQKEKENKLKEIEATEKKYQKSFEKLNTGIETINQKIYKIKSTYKSFQQELNKLKKEKPKEFQSIQNIISKNTQKKNKREKEKQNYDKDYKYLALLQDLYSDDGVKKKILESYLPTLNQEIAYTLNELHFPYKLRFNNNFEPELQHLGLDINVKTLSTGEKKRVDLAVLVSFIRMIKRKYPNLNIFMLDEVLSSIDGDGLYDILGLLKKTAQDMNIHIPIINHSMLPIEYFSRKIDVFKKDGFSDIEVTNL